MKINPDLLDKFAAGKCSSAEKLMIEKWIEDDTWDGFEEPKDIDEEVGKQMWDKLQRDQSPATKSFFWSSAAAAAVLFFLGFTYFYFQPKPLDSHFFTNESFDENMFISEDHYDVILSSNTNAQIDLINSTLNFSGDFVIKPKRDLELLDSDQNIIHFKAGHYYFVSDSPVFGKIVTFQKSDVAFLPLQIQYKIREKFACI